MCSLSWSLFGQFVLSFECYLDKLTVLGKLTAIGCMVNSLFWVALTILQMPRSHLSAFRVQIILYYITGPAEIIATTAFAKIFLQQAALIF